MMTLIGLAAITTTGTDIQISGNLRLSAKTFLIAEAGINHGMRALRGQNFDQLLAAATATAPKVQLLGSQQGISFDGGTYKVYLRNDYLTDAGDPGKNQYNSDNNDKIVIISEATYKGVTKIIESEVRRIAAGFPVFGGIGVAGAVQELEIENSVRITGDPARLPPGSPSWLTTTCNATSGIAVNDPAAQTAINNEITTNGKIKCDATNQTITGAAGSCSSAVQTNTGSTLNQTTIEQTADTLMKYADRTFSLNANTTMQDINWGTYDNPQITVVDFTNSSGTNELRIETTCNPCTSGSGSTGYGILIVHTNPANIDGSRLNLQGTFNWYGTIIFTGYSRAELGGGGGSNVNIYGGLVLANNGDTNNTDNRVRIRGNTNIYYNCAANQRAQDYSVITVNSWHETSS